MCLAVERAVKAGIVVVASAGNYGSTPDGKLVYGSVTSPGISPYAITVGALRTQGTEDPSDDEVAPWSSKGPTLVDHIVKPDLVAPGSKIVSTAVKGTTLVNQFPDRLVDGPGARDYFSMSGTSMSAAVVSGAVALLLDGSPTLSPMHVKLTLQASSTSMVQAGTVCIRRGLYRPSEVGRLKGSRSGVNRATHAMDERRPTDRGLDCCKRRNRLGQRHRVGKRDRLGQRDSLGRWNRLG